MKHYSSFVFISMTQFIQGLVLNAVILPTDPPQISEDSAAKASTINATKAATVTSTTTGTFSLWEMMYVYAYSKDKLRRLSEEDLLWLSHNVLWSYKYPAKEEKDTFQHAWLVQFPWLCYSEFCNGGFCVDCVLFAKPCPEKGGLYPGWGFYLIQSNGINFKSILKTIVFCSRQMIPLKGNWEHSGVPCRQLPCFVRPFCRCWCYCSCWAFLNWSTKMHNYFFGEAADCSPFYWCHKLYTWKVCWICPLLILVYLEILAGKKKTSEEM